jgi:hypothetical protein
MAEMSVFPDGHQKDVLDALALAEVASRNPGSPDDEYDEDDIRESYSDERSVVTGY